MASDSLTTSPYLASMSNRFASCGAGCRSPTASLTTIGMNQCVDSPDRECRGQRRTKERARVLFGNDEFVVGHLQCFGPGAHGASCCKVLQDHRLLEEASAIGPTAVVDDIGVDHRHAIAAGCAL